ncbi:MAG: CBS domain-containing protein [Bacteroidota bacterium]
MIAEHLISNDILPLRTTDTGDEALGVMNDFYLRHLPVVKDDNELVAIVSEDQLLDADPMATITTYDLPLQPVFVKRSAHLYDVMRILGEHKLTIIPVLDEDHRYLGLITLEDLIRFFAESSSFKDPGSIVVLEMGRHDYSLSEIARIVEGEGAIILSSFLQSFADSNRIQVTIKINGQQIGAILATFQRFDYNVKASFNEIELQNVLKERYDSLINYLNV